MDRIVFFFVGYQIYLIPTIKVTHDPLLYGHRGVELIWLKWGVEIKKSK